MPELVIYLTCVLPVLCMTAIVGCAGWLFWRIFARLETVQRDLLKVVCAQSEKPGAQALAGMMEGTDTIQARVDAEKLVPHHGPARRMAG